MTLETTDIFAIIVALLGSVSLMLWTMRINYLLQRQNFELRAELIKKELNL